MTPPTPLRHLLGRAIHLALALDPDTAEALGEFEGRSLALALREPRLELLLQVREGRLRVEDPQAGTADATVRGRVADVLSLRERRDALYTGAVEIDGDLGLVQRLSEVLRHVHVDIAEPLSRVLGDAAATRLESAGTTLRASLSRGATHLGRSASEYLHDDTGPLVSRRELARRLDDIDRLRADTDRLEARLARLERAHAG